MITLVLLLSATLACETAYYSTMEAFGVHKREILVDRVVEARDKQEEAKVQFQTTLEQFAELTNFDGGELEAKYNSLNNAYESSKARASGVKEQIEQVSSVGQALFAEWESELADYKSDAMRDIQAKQLAQSQARFESLVAAMTKAESKMQPVLDAFSDHVLFLKHSLNAQAIASLEGEVVQLESEVAELIAEMNASIAEANAFIDSMQVSQES